MSLRSPTAYSSHSGMRHNRSPLAAEAASSSVASRSSAVNSPAARCPSATEIAPVSVARSTTASGSKRAA